MNASLPSFLSVSSISFLATARSFSKRAISAGMSTAVEVSSSTWTLPPANAASIEAVAANSSSAGVSRVNAAAKSATEESPPISRAGTFLLGARPWSDRNRRTSVVSVWTSATQAAAAGSAVRPDAAGHGAITSDSPPVRAVQRVSVTNGTNGCSSLSNASRTVPRTALVVATRMESGSPTGIWTLASSRYQSQNSSHAKWYRPFRGLAELEVAQQSRRLGDNLIETIQHPSIGRGQLVGW